jgi:hypothetical protein
MRLVHPVVWAAVDGDGSFASWRFGRVHPARGFKCARDLNTEVAQPEVRVEVQKDRCRLWDGCSRVRRVDNFRSRARVQDDGAFSEDAPEMVPGASPLRFRPRRGCLDWRMTTDARCEVEP